MKHLRKFNEGNPEMMKVFGFINKVNALLNNDEYEEGDEPSKIDLLSEIGDLCNEFDMSADDIKKAIDSGKILNDHDNLVKIVYDETVESEEKRKNTKTKSLKRKREPKKKRHANNNVLQDDDLLSMIENHIFSEVYLRDVPYSMQEGAQELDPDSVKDAANAIVKMLKEKGLI